MPPQKAAILANDIYMSEEAFVAKYKNGENRVAQAYADGVMFYIIDSKRETTLVFRGTVTTQDIYI